MSDYTNEANYKEFVAVLAEKIEELLAPIPGWRERLAPEYQGPGGIDAFAAELTAKLLLGAALNTGASVKATCKHLKIKNTYKAIQAYLTGTFAKVAI